MEEITEGVERILLRLGEITCYMRNIEEHLGRIELAEYSSLATVWD